MVEAQRQGREAGAGEEGGRENGEAGAREAELQPLDAARRGGGEPRGEVVGRGGGERLVEEDRKSVV